MMILPVSACSLLEGRTPSTTSSMSLPWRPAALRSSSMQVDAPWRPSTGLGQSSLHSDTGRHTLAVRGLDSETTRELFTEAGDDDMPTTMMNTLRGGARATVSSSGVGMTSASTPGGGGRGSATAFVGPSYCQPLSAHLAACFPLALSGLADWGLLGDMTGESRTGAATQLVFR